MHAINRAAPFESRIPLVTFEVETMSKLQLSFLLGYHRPEMLEKAGAMSSRKVVDGILR
jgi:hypothetical protein